MVEEAAAEEAAVAVEMVLPVVVTEEGERTMVESTGPPLPPLTGASRSTRRARRAVTPARGARAGARGRLRGQASRRPRRARAGKWVIRRR